MRWEAGVRPEATIQPVLGIQIRRIRMFLGRLRIRILPFSEIMLAKYENRILTQNFSKKLKDNVPVGKL
jgi:hypothetical protein